MNLANLLTTFVVTFCDGLPFILWGEEEERWCADYRELNSCCVEDAFPLPGIEDCLDTLAGTQFLSTLDMASGYWQIDVVQLVLRGLLWHKCLVYIDDIICLREDFETALDNLRLVLERLHLNKLKLKPKKCALMQKQVRYLGRMVQVQVGFLLAKSMYAKLKNGLYQ